ncbi:MAG: hypothetical protein IAF38_01055 [Bacteroidia bacterium]|nr:hypothetical protein [Bacteroidia bacterium]
MPIINSIPLILSFNYNVYFGIKPGAKSKYFTENKRTYTIDFNESFQFSALDKIIPDSVKKQFNSFNYDFYMKKDSLRAKGIPTIQNTNINEVIETWVTYYMGLNIYNKTFNYLQKNKLLSNDSLSLNFLRQSSLISECMFYEYLILKYLEFENSNDPRIYNSIKRSKDFISLFELIHNATIESSKKYPYFKGQVLYNNPKLKNKDDPTYINDPFGVILYWVLPDKDIEFRKQIVTKELTKHKWLIKQK